MGTKDIITKDILRHLARDISKHILNLDIDDVELIDKEFTRVEKREADILYKSGNKIVHIEIQNNNHPKMHSRMLRYYSDLFFDYEDCEIMQYVIYIGKEKCTMKETIKKEHILYDYKLIDIKDISCQKFLRSDDPSAIALAVLCDFEGEDKQEVVNTIIRRLKTICMDELEFRSHLKMVEVLSTNRNLEKYIKKGEEEMLVIDLERLPSYEIGLEKGIEKGKLEGKLEGQKEEKQAIAKSMLLNNLDIDLIEEVTKLSKEEIESLSK